VDRLKRSLGNNSKANPVLGVYGKEILVADLIVSKTREIWVKRLSLVQGLGRIYQSVRWYKQCQEGMCCIKRGIQG
jgi:hypothetical protein